MTTETETTTTKAQTRGFPGLTCIHCGEPDGVRVDLVDMDLYCGECDRAFTVAGVRDTIDRWLNVIEWIERAPIVK